MTISKNSLEERLFWINEIIEKKESHKIYSIERKAILLMW